MVSWWPGDWSAGDIWSNNDGILQNGASFGPGAVGGGGQAFKLDGVDDYIEIPSTDIADTFTVDFWLNPEWSTRYEHLISNHYTNNGSFGARYLNYDALEYWQDGQVRFVQDVSGGSQNTITIIQPNTWSHIALVYNGSGIQVYVNGDEQSSIPTSGSVPHSETFNNALRIGSSIPHESSYFQGLIDDIEIYNRPLFQPEIRAIFEGGKCQKRGPRLT
ncbi:hypothetical protein Ngar_c22350 [Candidatus Nitrososphaera gargensis Ga9.2]|uniref:LamG-like jellyroll fold domain-containing protein n=1 Tax=Nitrososphaera gargensis (strain Ga9.2) TaxID=1237085 RepID=K0IH25_NITGG|nr:LamG domain-containing protein [Candidatus Nitrososphaera gargensis]AFU59165.1 hypothetical protein Ngar_c22350 [Candidatus Nitrososphaera gargensis Ga9.2]